MTSHDDLGREYWSCSAFTLISAVVGAAFSLASLQMGGGHEYALYAASRSSSLPLAVIFAMVQRSPGGLAAIAVAMTLVQFFDGMVGFVLHDARRAYGPLLFAAINLVLLMWIKADI